MNKQRVVTPSDYYELANLIVKVQLPEYFYTGFVATRLVPANKVNPKDLPPGASPDARPVNIGNASRRLITRAYYDEELVQTYNEILAPIQNGVGIKGGISHTIFGVQTALESEPNFGVIQGDIKNGYNEVKRESVLAAIKSYPALSNTVAFMQALRTPKAYIGMGYGINLKTAPFVCGEGEQQGAVESSFGFAIATIQAFKNLNEKLIPHGGGVTAIMDDNYLIGPRHIIFEANKEFAEDLSEVGLSLQPGKSKCFIREENRDEEWNALRGNIPNGTIKASDDQIYHGITVCNIPIGSQEFVQEYLKQRLKKITDEYECIQNLLDPARWANPEIPSRQMLWLLILIGPSGPDCNSAASL